MTNDELSRGQLGLHDWLYITAAPVGAEAVLGKRLIDAGALPVAGVYNCEFRCDGLTKLDIRLKATFASGSSTTSGGTTYRDRSAQLQAFTGVGAMSTTVEQPLALAALKGERYAKLIITTVGVLVTFTVAEVIGLRA